MRKDVKHPASFREASKGEAYGAEQCYKCPECSVGNGYFVGLGTPSTEVT